MSKQQDLISVFKFIVEFLKEDENQQLKQPKIIVEQDEPKESLPDPAVDAVKNGFLLNPLLKELPSTRLSPNLNALMQKELDVDKVLELMKKLDDIDKQNIHDKTIIDKTRKPLIKEISELKARLDEINTEAKEEEEIENKEEEVAEEVEPIDTAVIGGNTSIIHGEVVDEVIIPEPIERPKVKSSKKTK